MGDFGPTFQAGDKIEVIGAHSSEGLHGTVTKFVTNGLYEVRFDDDFAGSWKEHVAERHLKLIERPE